MTASSTTAEEKACLRRQVRAQLAALSPERLRESDRALFEAFLALPQVEEASSLFLFWGIPGREPETEMLVRSLAAQGKRVGLPRMLPERGMEVRLFQPEVPMAQASFGIWEPPESAPLLEREEIQLALVPGVCYDRDRYRLGFGGGVLRPVAGWIFRLYGGPVPGMRASGPGAPGGPRPAGGPFADGNAPVLPLRTAHTEKSGAYAPLSSKDGLQQPQPLSQPPQPLLQPQLLPPQLFPLPQQQHRMMISRMIHRQPLPPNPLFPQHIFVSPRLPRRGEFSPPRAFWYSLWHLPVPGSAGRKIFLG